VSLLKKLTLDGTSLVNYQLFWVLNEEFCELQAEDLVAMLSIGRGFGKEAERRAAQDVYPTIGSLVETLVLVNVGHIFLGIFAKHAHLLRLKELSVTVMDGNDVTALAECIAKIKTLRTISIHSDSAGVSLEPVLIRLRHSDNVNALTTNLCSTDGKKKLVMAYCETSATSTEARDGRLAAAAQDDHSTDAHGGKSISPTLLQTSMDLPRARQSRLIGSLLGLCESIGME
jgi:hypothetical protein